MGIPALEDGLFANLLIFGYLYYTLFVVGKGREKEGKRKGKREGKKRKENGREKGKGKRERKREGKKGREKGNEEGDGAKFENRRGLHCGDTHGWATLLTESEKHFCFADIVTWPWLQANRHPQNNSAIITVQGVKQKFWKIPMVTFTTDKTTH